jgi:hypothetical protein
MQSRAVWHWLRHCRSTAQTSGSGQFELKSHFASDGSWQTFWVASALAPASPVPSPSSVLTFTQRCGAGQSFESTH